MNRFISKKYSAYNKTNGIIGFVVKQLDIPKNINSINSLLTGKLKRITTTQVLTAKTIVIDFDYSYYSTHNSDIDTLMIYHLMFDFSKNISAQKPIQLKLSLEE